MTSEMRHLVQMADVRGVEIVCTNNDCTSKVMISPNSDKQPPAACPVCKQSHSFFDPELETWQAVNQLHAAIRYLLKNKAENIRIEVADKVS